MHDGQPQAGALTGGLGGVEKVEDLFLVFLGDAHAVVLDGDQDSLAVHAGQYLQGAWPVGDLLHGVDRIANQVEKDLLNLNFVGNGQIIEPIELKSYSHFLIFCADQCKRTSLFHELGYAFNTAFAFSASNKITQNN